MGKTNIEWTDFSWNPITGCTKGCSFCYARRMANRLRGRAGYPKDESFRPTLHPNRFDNRDWMRSKKPLKIFVCSMGDLFDPNVKIGWMWKVFDVIEQYPQHTFQVLTKNPKRLVALQGYLQLPKNLWVGVSICRERDKERLRDLWNARLSNPLFISFEPLLEDLGNLVLGFIDWVIIGALTGAKPMQPEKEWVQNIVDEAALANIPVFMKNNLEWMNPRKEFPKEMIQIEFCDVCKDGIENPSDLGGYVLNPQGKRVALCHTCIKQHQQVKKMPVVKLPFITLEVKDAEAYDPRNEKKDDGWIE